MCTCHNDGNPSNNHLENLRWDTRKNNEADKIKHGTATRGRRNPRAKLNEMQVRIIKRLLEFGTLKQTEIAKMFNVNKNIIHCIKIGKSWKYLKDVKNEKTEFNKV